MGNIVQGGGGVTDETLADAVALSNEYLKGAQENIVQQNQRATQMAEQFGLNPNFVTSTGTTNQPTGTNVIQTKVGAVDNSWFN